MGIRMRRTRFVAESEHLDRLLETSRMIQQAMDAASSGGVAYEFGKEPIITPVPMTVLNQLGFERPEERLVVGMLRDACKRVDVTCGSSADLTASFLLATIRELVRRASSGEKPRLLQERLQEEVEVCIASLSVSARRAGLNDAQRLVQGFIADEQAGSIVIEAMRLAGTNGRVHVDKAVGAPRTTIELSDGYSFKLEPVVSLSAVQPWKHANVRCLIIDGIIESVAEIHNIFEIANETKDPIAIFCRGYGKEVLTTISANRLRRTLNVHPIQVTFDPRTVNILNDIAVVCGCDVVSSLKGELISTIRYESLPVVESVSILGGDVTISHRRTAKAVEVQSHVLAQKRDETEIDGLREIYDSRIRSLTGTRVDVRVAGTPRESQARAEQIDAGLRLAKCVLSHGLVPLASIEPAGILEQPLGELVRRMAERIGQETEVPALLAASIIRQGARCAINLCLTAGLIVTD